MSPATAALVGVLFATGTYLMMNRTITRIILGVGVMGNGVNLLILSTGGVPGSAPIIGRDGALSDPVPQALVLTAIVIGFALQAFLLALAWRNWTIDGNDEVEDDLSDRILAGRAEAGALTPEDEDAQHAARAQGEADDPEDDR